MKVFCLFLTEDMLVLFIVFAWDNQENGVTVIEMKISLLKIYIGGI